jgi:hypothetical protein
MKKSTSRKVKLFLNILPFLLACFVFAGVKLGLHYPEQVEIWYSKGLYPVIASLVSSLSSMIRYSIWDIFWIGMLLLVLSGLVMVIIRKLRFRLYLLRVFQLMAITYSLFYLLWGYNYFRPSMEKRLGWHASGLKEEAFRNILDTLIDRANKTHIAVSASDYREMERAIEVSYMENSRLLGLRWPNGTREPKTILISSYFAKSGVSGYFSPFFGEVHINSYQLPIDYAFVVAHEKAHQFGIANEAEANLSAFITCTGSPDMRLQYAGYLHMLMYFLKDAIHIADYKDFIIKIDDKVIDDIKKREKYYRGLRNRKLEKIQSAANDAYLKTQNIESGIKNYNQVVGLVIRWYEFTGRLHLETGPVFADKN